MDKLIKKLNIREIMALEEKLVNLTIQPVGEQADAYFTARRELMDRNPDEAKKLRTLTEIQEEQEFYMIIFVIYGDYKAKYNRELKLSPFDIRTVVYNRYKRIRNALKLKADETEYQLLLDLLKQKSDEKPPGYNKMLQSREMNAISRTITRKISHIDTHRQAAVIEYKKPNKHMKILIEGIENMQKKMTVSSMKLLDYLLQRYTENGNYNLNTVSIPFQDYMDYRGLKDRKHAREQVKKDLQYLRSLVVEYNFNGDRSPWISLSLAGYADLDKTKDGYITIEFTSKYLELAQIQGKFQWMYISETAGRVDDIKYTHAYKFHRYLAEHMRMNFGKPNQNRVGVKSLVEASGEFPDYETLKTKHVQQLYVTPFEQSMDALQQYFNITWHYVDGVQPTSYMEFIDSYIIFAWEDYPDISHVRKNHLKLKAKSEAKSKAAKTKKTEKN